MANTNNSENTQTHDLLLESNQAPKVSVIVPVYKVEKYLPECIESILAQTFTDFELILVDDGSPDNSGKICDDYAARDSRIRVFHKENGGVSSARNLGLDNARGEWIAFVDSDDWIDTNMLQKMIAVAMLGTDLVISGYHTVKKTKRYTREGLSVLSGNSTRFFASLFVNGFINSPCFKLFRNKVISSKRIRFYDNIGIGEDTIFVTCYFKHIRRIVALKDALYFIRRTDCSAISRFHENIGEINAIFLSELKNLGLPPADVEMVALQWFPTVPEELVKPNNFSMRERLRILRSALSYLPVEEKIVVTRLSSFLVYTQNVFLIYMYYFLRRCARRIKNHLMG